MRTIKLSIRQEKILEIVEKNEPITGEEISKHLDLRRATLRPDLSILIMLGMLEARPKVGYFFKGKNLDKFYFNNISEIKVNEIKGVPVVVNEETTAYDAIVNMFLENVGSIYVVSEGGILQGIVSRKDLLKSTIGGVDINKIPVGVIMTRMPNIITVNIEDSILEAAIKLIDHEVDSVPIVKEVTIGNEKKSKLIGKISKTSIVRAFVDIYKK